MKPSALFSCLLAFSAPLWLGSCNSGEEYGDDEPKKKKKKKERPAPETPVLESSEQLLISEIVPHSSHGLEDGDGDTPDWIELYNNSSEAIELAGFALTDDPDEPLKWQLPARTLEAGAFLTIYASGKDRKEGDELHSNFKLDGDGEYLALVQMDGSTPIHTFAPVFPEVPKGQSYGYEFTDGQIALETLRMFENPSPGTPNSDDGSPVEGDAGAEEPSTPQGAEEPADHDAPE